MTLVAAFAVSAYGYCTARAGHKPFNPLLGETFECIRDDKGFKYIAEQVNNLEVCFFVMLSNFGHFLTLFGNLCSTRAGHKPFNPLLGETFECIRDDKGFKYIAEQVNEFINYLFDVHYYFDFILFEAF